MIIGICGLIGSGKGTVADILIRDHGFVKVSFADSLKDCVASVFGWPRNLLEGDTVESRQWREEVDEWWSNSLGMPDLTPRAVLQQWGTEVCRTGFHNDIWVLSLKSKLKRDSSTNYVVPDTRFLNEMDAIRDLGGSIWKVRRGDDPDWMVRYTSTGETPCGIHESEWRWASGVFDHVIENDSSIESLGNRVAALVDRRLNYVT